MPREVSPRKIIPLVFAVAIAFAFVTTFAHPSAAAPARHADASAAAVGPAIQNDVFWKDTSGNPIYSQGGGVLKVGGTYYWYGAKYNGAVSYYNNPAGGSNSNTSFSAITAYSSTDLVHWKFEGNAVTASDVGGGGWVGRVGIAHNANTGKYVLIAQLNSGLMFATNSTPTGHFAFAGTQSSIGNVSTGMSGDQSVFVDDDGQAYLAFSNKSGRSNLYVAPLRTSDYLHVENATRIYSSSSGGREGNIMFKYNGTYYMCSSDLHGWNASHTYCIMSKNIYNSYSPEFVMQGTDADFSHVTQSGLAFTVTGTSGSFVMFGGDRWSDFAGNGIGYNDWAPVTFNGTTPTFHSLSAWDIDAAAGTWSVDPANNYVLNPSFEADRVSQKALAGWTNSTTAGSDPNSNQLGGHTGRWAITQSSSSAYTSSRYENISVPNGTYALSAWVKSSGGQKAANIFAKNFGGSEMDHSINQSISGWTKVTISGITVTNGSIQVGVYSNANAGNWVNVDDYALVQTGSSGGGDTVAPSAPTGLSVTATTADSASLSWSAATDNVGVTGYDVYRGGALVGSSTGTSYTDTGLSADTSYTYTVRARDAAGNTSADSASVTATTSTGSSGGTSGELHAVGAGRCVDVPNSTQTNGTQVQIWDCTGASNQVFAYNSAHEFTVYGGAKCLDANAKGTTAGTTVIIYDCNGGTNQQWNVNSNGTITGVQSGLCLDVTNRSTANGALVELWTCNGGTNQQWSF